MPLRPPFSLQPLLSPQHQGFSKAASYLKERKANPHANGTSLSKANNRSIRQMLRNSGLTAQLQAGVFWSLPTFLHGGEDGFWIKDGKMCPLWGRLTGGVSCSRVGAKGPTRAGNLCSCRSVSISEPVGSQRIGAKRGWGGGWHCLIVGKNPDSVLSAPTGQKSLSAKWFHIFQTSQNGKLRRTSPIAKSILNWFPQSPKPSPSRCSCCSPQLLSVLSGLPG